MPYNFIRIQSEFKQAREHGQDHLVQIDALFPSISQNISRSQTISDSAGNFLTIPNYFSQILSKKDYYYMTKIKVIKFFNLFSLTSPL